MGWSIGWDSSWHRDVGYGVPAQCDQPGCVEQIDRGLSYVCGGQSYGGEHGCGLYFCGTHLILTVVLGGEENPADDEDSELCWRCARCASDEPPFEAKPDIAEWVTWKLTDDSWQQWRDENPDAVVRLTAAMSGEPA